MSKEGLLPSRAGGCYAFNRGLLWARRTFWATLKVLLVIRSVVAGTVNIPNMVWGFCSVYVPSIALCNLVP